MRYPVDSVNITQGYSAGHPALDLGAPLGTEEKAPESGVVIAVNNNPAGYFGGNYIKIRGDSGYTHYMGHNQKNIVGVNQRVSEGQVIGYIGQTGFAVPSQGISAPTGPHTHWQVSNTAGATIDPRTIIKQGEDMTIQNNDAYYSRYGVSLAQMTRGRILSREEFVKYLVGQTDLHAIEILSDDPEAKVAQHWQDVGRGAVQDNWEGQIYSLQDQVKSRDKLIAEIQKKADLSDALQKKIDELNAQKTDDSKLLDDAGNIFTRFLARFNKKG